MPSAAVAHLSTSRSPPSRSNQRSFQRSPLQGEKVYPRQPPIVADLVLVPCFSPHLEPSAFSYQASVHSSRPPPWHSTLTTTSVRRMPSAPAANMVSCYTAGQPPHSPCLVLFFRTSPPSLSSNSPSNSSTQPRPCSSRSGSATSPTSCPSTRRRRVASCRPTWYKQWALSTPLNSCHRPLPAGGPVPAPLGDFLPTGRLVHLYDFAPLLAGQRADNSKRKDNDGHPRQQPTHLKHFPVLAQLLSLTN